MSPQSNDRLAASMIGVDDGTCAEFEDEVHDEEDLPVNDDVDSEFACGDCEVENIKPMTDPGNPALNKSKNTELHIYPIGHGAAGAP